MSEDTTAAPEPQEGTEQDTETFDAEYVAKLRKEAAKYRTEAKANADAARRLAEIEQASKTEAERTTERITALEQQLAEATRAAIRSDVAAKYGIAPEDRDLFLTGADEDTLVAQAQRLAQREADRKKQGNVAPREGNNPTPGTGDKDGLRDFTRNLFGAAAADD